MEEQTLYYKSSEDRIHAVRELYESELERAIKLAERLKSYEDKNDQLLLEKKGALSELTDAKAKEIRGMIARRIRK